MEFGDVYLDADADLGIAGFIALLCLFKPQSEVCVCVGGGSCALTLRRRTVSFMNDGSSQRL